MNNVLLFMSDQHNPRYSSVYGHAFVSTPALERLAARGTTYEHAYCPSPLCVPSRSAFMTGRWVNEIQRYNNCKVIEGRFPSYGAVLAAQGIHTTYLGAAANLYRDPAELGFSEMVAADRTRRLLQPSALQGGTTRRPSAKVDTDRGPVPDKFATDIAHVDLALEWLRDKAPQLGRPWQITINVSPPHPPYTADRTWWRRYHGYGDLPEHGADVEPAQHAYAQDKREYGGWTYPDNVIRAIRQGYYAMVSFVDHELGRVLDAVDAAGLRDSTVTAYTSDHGEMLGELGLWGKATLYEDSARIPLVVAGPGFEPGARVTTPVSLMDVQAAMFTALGAERPATWHGTPLQRVPDDDPDRAVFAEYHGPGPRGSGYLIRRRDWKLIFNMEAPHQLFQLGDDPHELRNLYATRPDVAAGLEADLRSVCNPEAVAEDVRVFTARQRVAIANFRRDGAETVPWEEAPPSAGAPQ